MGVLSIFNRPRIKTAKNAFAPFTHVKGDIFDPGAEVYSYLPEQGNPKYVNRVFPQWNFSPPGITQPELEVQFLSLIPDPLQGYNYGPYARGELVEGTDYPNVEGDYYE